MSYRVWCGIFEGSLLPRARSFIAWAGQVQLSDAEVHHEGIPEVLRHSAIGFKTAQNITQALKRVLWDFSEHLGLATVSFGSSLHIQPRVYADTCFLFSAP